MHRDELWAPCPEWCIGVQGVNSSLLRDPFNCHILLCSPTATNTISLNNLVFVGRDVLRSCLFIFAYQLGECDEKNDSLYVLYFMEEEVERRIRAVVDFYEKLAYKWTQIFCWILSAYWTSCYTEVLTCDLFTARGKHNIWYLSGAFSSVHHGLPGRWIDLQQAWMHCGTLHGAHIWKSATFMVHYLQLVDRRSACTHVQAT